METPGTTKKTSFFPKFLLALVFVYGLGHLPPGLVPASSFLASLTAPQAAFAQDEEEFVDEEEEFVDEEEEFVEEGEGGGEEAAGEEEGDEEAAGEEEEDLSYLTDIGPAKEHEFEPFSFLGSSNRKFTWFAAQMHILFASFILGCPMFVVIMEVMGARRTQGVRKAIILSNVFLGILIGVVIGITGEIIVGIHHGVLYGLYSCAFGALMVSFLNYFHRLMNVKASAVVGAIFGTIMAVPLTPVEHYEVSGIVLALINGVVGGVLANMIMFAKADFKFERLAHEITKVIGMCYSFTALSGGLFLFVMLVAYKDFISYLVATFPMLFMVAYPTLFILETVVMYIYVYSWDPLNQQNKKGRHIVCGIILNVLGLSLLCALDGPATFMQTPPKPLGELMDMSEWSKIATMTWMPLNYHRLVGNGTFGGYMVGIIGAYMYLWSKKKEEREYYDWVGYMGNIIGVAIMIPLPAMGYIFVREIYQYDATIGMYIMSDRESMFMLVQGLLVGTMFSASNIYMWVSMKRIENAQRFFPAMKFGFILIVISATIWFTPRRFFATMLPEPGMNPEMVLPDNLAFLALMISKNTAAFALVTVTFINYIFYTIATKTGKVHYGKINPLGPYILIFLGFADIWLMSWMGTIRELSRMNWHVYKVFKDVTPEKFAPTLAESGFHVTTIVWTFFIIMTAIVWLAIKYPKTKKKTEGAPSTATPQMAE
ncbi:MAG: hypothetical protein JSU88_01160 [Nitrospinaceae bacterium]|jgi:cytochrome bd-type quinol oxidase subunit 1|nr:MAG: hypothetical protein JSU88_01160 [Nitrospinaceae bacterium]